jgi:hypothetical protein
MATKSRALSRFPAKTIGQAGLATLAFAGALAVIPAAAGEPVALLERITSYYQRSELMSYAYVGQVIRLSPDQTMELSYSCTRETITGGTITIGTEQSEVQSGQVRRIQGTCTAGKAELRTRLDSNPAGGRSFRGSAH